MAGAEVAILSKGGLDKEAAHGGLMTRKKLCPEDIMGEGHYYSPDLPSPNFVAKKKTKKPRFLLLPPENNPNPHNGWEYYIR